MGILVILGFFGYFEEGNMVMFLCGGLDIIGLIVVVGVKVDLYENFIDVDVIYSVDLRFVEKFYEMKEVIYREMCELFYVGFFVFYDEVLELVYKLGIFVCVKNINNFEVKGIFIVVECFYGDMLVVGIVGDKGFCNIYVSKYLLNCEIGFGRRLFEILEDEGILYEYIFLGIDNIFVIMCEY